MGVIRVLTAKPWTENRLDEAAPRARAPGSAAKLGLGMFLAVVTVLFLLLVSAYFGRMALDDWRPLPEPWLLWPNTAVLAASSIALHWARVAARRERIVDVRTGLSLAGILALGFLAGQYMAWQAMIDLGYAAATNPANAFFYLITALHGAHLLGGLVAWGVTTAVAWRDDDASGVRLRIELCSIYWHFLLLVWVLLFALLLADNEGGTITGTGALGTILPGI